jgi:hypothetical protein
VSPRVRRFVYVTSKRGDNYHMAANRSEGLTFCGRPVLVGKWKWVVPGAKVRKPVCTQCAKRS